MTLEHGEFSRTMRINIPDKILGDLPANAKTLAPKKDRKEYVRPKAKVETVTIPRPDKRPDDTSKYEELLQNIYDAALITDLAGNISEFNERAQHFFGYSTEEFAGMNILDLIVNAEEELLESIHTSLEHERHVLIQAFGARKNDSTFSAEIAVNLLRIPELQLCFFVRDTTEQKRAEEAVRTMQKQEAMVASVGAACHHLGQPATVLLANLSLMQSGQVDKELVDTSMQAAERIADTLHKLNAVHEYKTVPYAQGAIKYTSDRILEI